MSQRFRDYRIGFYCRGDGKWSWRLVAPNKKIIAVAGQGYSSRSNAVRAARRLSPAVYWANIK